MAEFSLERLGEATKDVLLPLSRWLVATKCHAEWRFSCHMTWLPAAIKPPGRPSAASLKPPQAPDRLAHVLGVDPRDVFWQTAFAPNGSAPFRGPDRSRSLRRCGETGKRAGLEIRWSRPLTSHDLAGSNPAAATSKILTSQPLPIEGAVARP